MSHLSTHQSAKYFAVCCCEQILMVRDVSKDRVVSSHFHSPRSRPFLFSPYPFSTTLRSVQLNESRPHTPSTHRVMRRCDVTGELISSQTTQFRVCSPFFLWSFQMYPTLVFLGVVPPRDPHLLHVLPRISPDSLRNPDLHIPMTDCCPDVVCATLSSSPSEPSHRPTLRCPLSFRPLLLNFIQSCTELF